MEDKTAQNPLELVFTPEKVQEYISEVSKSNPTDPAVQQAAAQKVLESMSQATDPKAVEQATLHLNQLAQQEPNNPLGQAIDQSMGQQTQTMASSFSGSRELLVNLNKRYASENLDFMEALRVWKRARLNPDAIRQQIGNDIGVRVSFAEAKHLHKISRDVVSGHIEEDFGIDYATEILNKMSHHKRIKLTPSVREAVERVGQNLFRTKRANVLWKIDMKYTDDGQEVPYLIRIDSVEAEEEGNIKEGK